MGKVLYWEDVSEGQEIPPLVKHPTTQQLVKYAGASGDFYQIHYDKDFALANGLPGVIIHGALKNAWLGQLITDWIGEYGTLKKLSCQYRGMDVPGDTLTAKGRVTRKYVQDGQHFVECEIWIENSKGERTTPGSATVILPSRANPLGA
ncbi:MAG: MaoC/PaaZ C-terminal domain-containing protein [Dehalococcoidia bacterium]|nr:MaoC/PaaZ C-terminal domain-containing protein [Dehalococcoidia bacterium]MDW8119941.1 MaoC/PaaZ C-terminal domain-containing protein [Chloroflexota bacterium]